MVQWIACIIAYNEESLLPKCLDSIQGKVDKVVLVEGRIAAFPGEYFYSQDRTLEVAHDYGCKVISASDNQCAWEDEATMRNQYLIGNDGDWYFMIDADEKLMTPLPDIEDMPDRAQSFAVNVNMIGDSTSIYRPRLFRHSGQMEYRQIHDALFSDGKLISSPSQTPRLKSIWIAHYQMARDAQRRLKKNYYYTNGYTHEPEYRRKWRMFNDG